MIGREQLQQAIAVQESLRGTIDDAILDATIAALRQQLEQLDAAESAPPQRKLATVLFMDIAGHTQLVQQLDPEEIFDLVDGALQRLAVPVEESGGQIVRYQGDGFKAVFGLPVAQEKDPDHAIRAGLQIVALAAGIAAEWRQRGLPGFNVRVGIDSGLVLAGGGTEGQDAVTGLPVNLAARLESAAAPGTVLISQHTYQHVRGVFDVEPLAPIAAKGFPEPVAVYRVLRPSARAFRTRRRGIEGVPTRMIGRDAELRQLQAAFTAALAQRQFQMVTVVGEAGLGKSRLLAEFEDWADLQPARVQIYRGRARPETQRQPFSLLRDILAFRFGIHDDDSSQTVRDKLVGGFRETIADANLAEIQAHFVGHLVGYNFSDSPHVRPLLDNPQRLRSQTLAYLAQYFQVLAAESPLLVLLEDLHWADDSTLEAFPGLVQTLARRPVLIAGATRPDLFVRQAGWLADAPWHARIDLALLPEDDSRQLVGELLQKILSVPDELRDLLVERAEGNPFYLEELIKMFIDEGVILKEGAYWRVAPEKLVSARVPATLTGILQARLDSLSRGEKDALQRASVVGRLFWDTAVAYVGAAEEPVASGAAPHVWQALGERDFILSREETSFDGAREYVFKHALLRDVTYESVLRRLRQRYHERAAEWLIAASGERADEFAEIIAKHFELAGVTEREAVWQERAGIHAAARYAHHEALPAFNRAIDLTPPENPAGRYDLIFRREAILHLRGERVQQLADIEALESLARELDDPQRQAEAALRRSAYLHVVGDYAGAVAASQDAARWAAAGDSTGLQAAVQLRLGSLWMHQGEYSAAEACLQRALELARDGQSPRVEMEATRLLGVTSEELGNFTEERQYFERALALAIQHKDQWGERRALNSLGVVSYGLGQYTPAAAYYEESLALARQLGDRVGEVTVLGNLGTLYGTMGDYGRAEALYREALQHALDIEDRVGQCTTLLNLGAVTVALDRAAEALAIYEEAEALTTAVGDRPIEGYVLNGAGFALLADGRPAEAADMFARAVALREELGQQHLAIESRAGLAAARLAADDLPRALAEVTRVLDFLAIGMLEQSEEYFRVPLICYQVLERAGDERARPLLAGTVAELQAAAARLDEPWRRLFLEAIPWHRDIVAAWQAIT